MLILSKQMINTTTPNTEINLNEVYVAYDVPIPQVMIRDKSPQSESKIQKNKCCSCCCCCTDNKTNI
jgi:hypothetical protein